MEEKRIAMPISLSSQIVVNSKHIKPNKSTESVEIEVLQVMLKIRKQSNFKFENYQPLIKKLKNKPSTSLKKPICSTH
jgi:hypothetical protein